MNASVALAKSLARHCNNGTQYHITLSADLKTKTSRVVIMVSYVVVFVNIIILKQCMCYVFKNTHTSHFVIKTSIKKKKTTQ